MATDRWNPDHPSWFTPVKLLMVFCAINMINYVDRGAIASNGVNGSRRTCSDNGVCTSGSGIQGAFDLNYFQDGVLSSAFMVGLLLASPIFSQLTKYFNPFRLIGVGLSVWTIAVIGCGFSFDFWSITICRMLVGVGEASFISLAAPFIDDSAPKEKKGAWLSMFYMCIPAGIALGYVYGGVVGTSLNWRYAFWGEAILMLPFAVLGFFIEPLQLKGFESSKPKLLEPSDAVYGEYLDAKSSVTANSEGGDSKQLFDNVSQSEDLIKFLIRISGYNELKILLLEKVYVVNVLGYIAYNFVIGAYSYWGPKAGYSIYHMSNADLMFGGVTIVCGIFGTYSGGVILDKMQSTIPNAFKVLSGATFLGAIFCLAAFCSKNLYIFLVLFSIGELCVFATQSPVNFICLHCVNPGLRAASVSIATVSIHIFGDVPSSPLVGVLQDHVHNWRITALILTSIFFLASLIWFGGIFLNGVDRYEVVSEDSNGTVERSDMRPLLDGNAIDAADMV